jgi:hypothetical protein
MSGLIWAGIGKGIADAGTTFGSYMLKDIEDQRRREDEERREANAIKRAEEADRIRAEREEQKAEALKQRVTTETAQVEQRATQMGTERRTARLDSDAGKLSASSMAEDREGLAIDKEKMLELLRNDPALRESYRKLGLIEGAAESTRDPRMIAAEDRVTAAMGMGAHSSVLDAYTKARKDTLDEIRRENEQKRAEAAQAATDLRLDQQGRKTDALIQYLGVKGDVADRNAETAEERERRLAKGGGKAASGGGQPSLKNMTPERLSAEADILRKAADKANGERKQNLEAQFDEVIAEMARRRKQSPGAAPAPAPGASRTASTTKNYSNLWK